MPRHKLTDTEIKIRICPQRLRWPEASAGSVWDTAHRCVDALQNFVRGVDTACCEVEEDQKLSADAIARRRSQICDQSLRKLLNFAAFEVAEKELTRGIDALERLPTLDARESQLHQAMTKALADLGEGIEATKRLLLDRCRTRERASV